MLIIEFIFDVDALNMAALWDSRSLYDVLNVESERLNNRSLFGPDFFYDNTFLS